MASAAQTVYVRPTALSERLSFLPAASQTGKSKTGINRCDLLLGRRDLALLLQHAAHVVILEWAHGFIKTTVASQLNIILCWRMKNLIAPATELYGPSTGNPVRTHSLWTIDLRPLSPHWYNKPSILPLLSLHVSLTWSFPVFPIPSLLFAAIDLHIINLCQLLWVSGISVNNKSPPYSSDPPTPPTPSSVLLLPEQSMTNE